MRTANKGFFIVIEGIDGTGKTSQVRLLAAFLKGQGHSVLATREPSDGPHGREIRRLFTSRQRLSLEDELELFLRDRRQHVDEEIEPALAVGKVVICDRYYHSTAAYQGAAGLDPAEILRRNRFAPTPDLVLHLVLDPELALRRIRELRGEKPNDFEQEDQLRKVAALFDSFNEPCIRRVNASGSMDQVQRELRTLVESLLPRPRQ